MSSAGSTSCAAAGGSIDVAVSASASTTSSNNHSGGGRCQSLSSPSSSCDDRHHPHYLCSFVAGGLAGATSRTATAPLDRVKILAQEGLIHSGAPQPLHGNDGVPLTCRRIVWSPSLYLQRLRGSSKLINIARHIFDEGGARAFWRGNGVNCMKAGPEFALVFYVRSVLSDCIEFMKKRETSLMSSTATTPLSSPSSSSSSSSPSRSLIPWRHLSQTASNFLCGAAAGAVAQTALYPLELLKTRMAVAKSGEYPGGLRDCILASYRRGGLGDFYRGLTPNLMGIVPYRGIEVGLFYTFRQNWERRLAADAASASAAATASAAAAAADGGGGDVPGAAQAPPATRAQTRKQMCPKLSVTQTAVIGTVASVIAQTVTYPLNIARTRLQTQGVNGRPVLYRGMVDCFVKVLQSDGLCGLFSGLGANYLKAVPASAIVFVVFSETESALDRWMCPDDAWD